MFLFSCLGTQPFLNGVFITLGGFTAKIITECSSVLLITLLESIDCIFSSW
ncbi:hypothetical protein [uncultured Desulfobacter sp.]|uniref:hypothetical protein n=1 Tax=uncultured Desulfobacter sp. TaxID=240139 RepID=UPI002AAC4841|nr:hypothetical protein [uncultured Desulfobacter sp.]